MSRCSTPHPLATQSATCPGSRGAPKEGRRVTLTSEVYCRLGPQCFWTTRPAAWRSRNSGPKNDGHPDTHPHPHTCNECLVVSWMAHRAGAVVCWRRPAHIARWAEGNRIAVCRRSNGLWCVHKLLKQFPAFYRSKMEHFAKHFSEIVTTHNDEICYVKHVLDPPCVFFTLLGCGVWGGGGGGLPRGLWHNLLTQFSSLGSSKMEISSRRQQAVGKWGGWTSQFEHVWNTPPWHKRVHMSSRVTRGLKPPRPPTAQWTRPKGPLCREARKRGDGDAGCGRNTDADTLLSHVCQCPSTQFLLTSVDGAQEHQNSRFRCVAVGLGC